MSRDWSRPGWPGRLGAVAALLSVGLAAAVVPAKAGEQGPELRASIWLSGGESPVLRRGDRERLYYRTSADAYVAVFHVDTDGIVRLLYPRVPGQDHYVRGGRDYRLLFGSSSRWHVRDEPGVGYFFVVASRHPFRFAGIRYSRHGRGWDLSGVGRRLHRDPYEAVEAYAAHLVDRRHRVGHAVDLISYHVGRRHPYPRFLCYECHAFRTYRSWNPYHRACRGFRIVVSTDPRLHPVLRYGRDRVVQPRRLLRELFPPRLRDRGHPEGRIRRPPRTRDDRQVRWERDREEERRRPVLRRRVREPRPAEDAAGDTRRARRRGEGGEADSGRIGPSPAGGNPRTPVRMRPSSRPPETEVREEAPGSEPERGRRARRRPPPGG